MSLRVENLSFSYGQKAILHNITTSFKSGEITVIAGPNGAGKSTFVKTIMNLIRTDKNSIFLNDRDIQTFPILERSRFMSYISQNGVYDFDFSVYEIVEMGRYPYKKEWDQVNDKKAIKEALQITNTLNLIDRSINSLSGGELQRVLLARALAGKPEYLILDEPASNLDISHSIEMMKLLKKLTIERGLTTIIVLHDLNTMLHYGDSILILKNGKLKMKGDTKAILIPRNIKDIFGINTQIIEDSMGKFHILTV